MKAKKEFLNGREVMEHYVKGYEVASRVQASMEPVSRPSPTGADLARGLVRGLRSAISSDNGGGSAHGTKGAT